jgi:hypothetical protein
MPDQHTHQLLPHTRFLARLVRHASISVALLGVALGIGVIGYHTLENLSWVDSILNAAMLLGGMGPVSALQTTAGKLFASAYALFSGVFVLGIAGLLFAPIYHRLLHAFHLEGQSQDTDS